MRLSHLLGRYTSSVAASTLKGQGWLGEPADAATSGKAAFYAVSSLGAGLVCTPGAVAEPTQLGRQRLGRRGSGVLLGRGETDTLPVETVRHRPCRWKVRGYLRCCDYHLNLKRVRPRWCGFRGGSAVAPNARAITPMDRIMMALAAASLVVAIMSFVRDVVAG